jgi:hypothetical protein
MAKCWRQPEGACRSPVQGHHPGLLGIAASADARTLAGRDPEFYCSLSYPEKDLRYRAGGGAMVKGKADLIDEQGNLVATFNETCHDYGVTVAIVRLHAPLAPFTLQGTELLALFAQGIVYPVISVESSDPAGTEIREFHGTS